MGRDERAATEHLEDGDRADVRGRPPRALAPTITLLPSKLMRPANRLGSVARTLIVDRLLRSDQPIVSLVAPAGYGKTTVLAQWAERSKQAFAWVCLDEDDDDPRAMLAYVAEALDGVEPIGDRVFAALASMKSSPTASALPRLASAFAAMSSPVVLVLDDVHLLENLDARTAVSLLAEHVPPGSRLVLAGRHAPPLPLRRLRDEGRLLEIGPGDLALSSGEASQLMSNADVALAADQVTELHRRTEGWPAALYLAALFVREAGSVDSFTGSDRFISEYVESEVLEGMSGSQRLFLTRTAILERLCGPLCDAVLRSDGSAEALAELASSHLLLVPLDGEGHWYRYHQLFRDMLLAELERLEPMLVPELRQRAADWWGQHAPEDGLARPLEAVDTAGAADLPAAGGIVSSLVSGRQSDAHHGGHQGAFWRSGRRDGPHSQVTRAWARLVQAERCRHGVARMRADADEAARLFDEVDPSMVPVSLMLQGMARVYLGEVDQGEDHLRRCVAAAEAATGPHHAIALAELSRLAMERGEAERAAELLGQARDVLRRSEPREGIATPFVCAVDAWAALHDGDHEAAHRHVVEAQRVRRRLVDTVPFLAVEARLLLARAQLGLNDLSGARTLMGEIDGVLRATPDLGRLQAQARALREELTARPGAADSGSTMLTVAELRLLPLLSTHLTVPEVAADLHLSPHTVRAQVQSIYRKLGTRSRSETVAKARAQGLLVA